MNEQTQGAEIVDLEEQRRLRQATGGGGPPARGDWLSKMEHGTRFLAKEIGKYGSEVEDFIVATPPHALGEVVLLARNIKGRDGVFEWHDPAIFSRNYKLYLELEVIRDGGDQSLQSERLAGHEDAEKPTGLHEIE